jgi:hypothetical protein|tara:strand:+ start:407 stop:664 length:258 start_codon:yes stop_codon:yes gene_type:complete
MFMCVLILAVLVGSQNAVALTLKPLCGAHLPLNCANQVVLLSQAISLQGMPNARLLPDLVIPGRMRQGFGDGKVDVGAFFLFTEQ